MSGGFWITQDGHLVDLIKPISEGSGQVASTRFNMADYNHASIYLRFGASGGPLGTVTLLVYKQFTGGSGVAIPFRYFLQNAGSAPFDVFSGVNQATSAGFTSVSSAVNAGLVIEVDTAELSAANNGTYLELDILLLSNPQLLDAFGILSGGRFQADQSVSVQQ